MALMPTGRALLLALGVLTSTGASDDPREQRAITPPTRDRVSAHHERSPAPGLTERAVWAGATSQPTSLAPPCETLAKYVGENEGVPARYCAQRAEQPNHHPPVRRKIQPSLRRGRTWLARRQAASFASSAPTPCIAINPADASRERLDRVRPAPAETLER